MESKGKAQLPKSPIPKIIPRGYSLLFEIENRFLNVLPGQIFEDTGDLLSLENRYKKNLAKNKERMKGIYEDIVKRHDDKIKGQEFAKDVIDGKKRQLYSKAIDELSNNVQQQVAISVIKPSDPLALTEFNSLHLEVKNIWLELDCRIERIFGSEMKAEYKSRAFCVYQPQIKPVKNTLFKKNTPQVYVRVNDLKHLADDVENGIMTCRTFMKLLINKENTPLPENHGKIELSLISCIERLKILLIELPTIQFICPKPKGEHILYDMIYYDLPLKLQLARDMLLTIYKATDQPVSKVKRTTNFWKSDIPFKLIEQMHNDYEKMLDQSENLAVLKQVIEKHILDLENLAILEQINSRDEKSEEQPVQAKNEKEVISDTEPQNVFRSTDTGYIIRFQGSKEYPFGDLDGLFYIKQCLEKPNKAIKAKELVSLKRGMTNSQPHKGILNKNFLARKVDENIDEQSDTITDYESDKETIENYRKRVHEIIVEKKEAEREGDFYLKEKLDEEFEFIEKELSRLTDKDGRARPEINRPDSLRSVVSSAIGYSFKKIEKVLPELYSHLKQHLKKGHELQYSGNIDWEL